MVSDQFPGNSRPSTKRGACVVFAGSSVDEGRGAGFPDVHRGGRCSSKDTVPAPFCAGYRSKLYTQFLAGYR